MAQCDATCRPALALSWTNYRATVDIAATVAVPNGSVTVQCVRGSGARNDLDHALAEVRRDLIRQIEDERSRREPRKRRKTRYRTT
jgi:hypothetical protein